MTTEELHEYINCLELGNASFQTIKNHPLIAEIKKDANLRYIVPEKVEKPVDVSTLETVWTTNRYAKNIAAFLRLNGFTVDYKTSTVSKDGGKNNQKVGRVLNALNPKLLESWKNITNEGFSTKTGKQKQWIISANPVDICGSSYKRKWSSCTSDGHHMNGMTNGKFSLIAYLCDVEDLTIKNPHCRYFIHIGIPAVKPKTVVFKLTGDNVPPGKPSLTLKTEPTTVQTMVGTLFMDTKYGNCSNAEYVDLVSFIDDMNDKVLDMNGVTNMAITIKGLYVNTYNPPTEVVHSSIRTEKIISKKTNKVKVKTETLATRAKQYNQWSNRPGYELVEYVINKSYFCNKYLTNAIILDKELCKFVSDETINISLKKVQDTIEEQKQKLIGSKNYTEITQITDAIAVDVKNYDSLIKLQEKVHTLKDGKETKKNKVKAKIDNVPVQAVADAF